jgi:hypothetical protein
MCANYVVGWAIPTCHIFVKGSGYPCISRPVDVILQLLSAISVLSLHSETTQAYVCMHSFVCVLMCYFVLLGVTDITCYVLGQGIDLSGSCD